MRYFTSLENTAKCEVFRLLPSSFSNRVTYLLCDFHWNNVITMNVLVIQPSIGWAHKVLVFYVDESFGATNGMGISPHNWVVNRTAFFSVTRLSSKNKCGIFKLNWLNDHACFAWLSFWYLTKILFIWQLIHWQHCVFRFWNKIWKAYFEIERFKFCNLHQCKSLYHLSYPIPNPL